MRTRERIRMSLLLLLGTWQLCGCKQELRRGASSSAIVETVEQAGAGPLDGLDEAAIQMWLNAHLETAKQISPPCKQAGGGASAAWARSTEGIVCAADAQVMFTMPTNLYKPY